MSDKYLPLDRKHTSLQQVKNLLAYDQHVCITFDAHDRIIACREFLASFCDSRNGIPKLNPYNFLNNKQLSHEF